MSVDERVRGILERLEERAQQLLPDWRFHGSEDPGRALLEAVATVLAKIDTRLDAIPDALLAETLAQLGESARWPSPAVSAVCFEAADDLTHAVLVPKGTCVSNDRTADVSQAEGGGVALSFETTCDTWISPAQLEACFSAEGERITELPRRLGSARIDEHGAFASTTVFRATERERHLLFGDPVFSTLVGQRGEVVLEWPGLPEDVALANWQYSVRGGWQQLPVLFDQSSSVTGEPVLRMRIVGPLPDLAPARVGETRMPWIRVAEQRQGEVAWRAPELVWAPPVSGVSAGVPRTLARAFCEGDGGVEDRSLSAHEGVSSNPCLAERSPAVYFGMDRALPASVYWDAAQQTPDAWPAAELVWEYSTGAGFAPLEIADETAGFARSGTIAWPVLDDWQAQENSGRTAFWIRARWVGGAYYTRPSVRNVVVGGASLIEGLTHSDVVARVESIGDKLSQLQVEADAWARFDAIEIEVSSGEWESFRRVDDRRALGRQSFLLERRVAREGVDQVLRLSRNLEGTCRARIPKLRVLSAAAEGERSDLELRVLELESDALARVRQIIPSRGVAMGESLEELAARVKAEWRREWRAVTVEDIQDLVSSLEPESAQVDVFERGEGLADIDVVLLARPPVRPGRISPARLRYLQEFLSERAPLGIRVRVSEACLIPIRVEVVCDVDTSGAASDVEQRASSAIRSWIDPVTGGEQGTGFPLGRRLLRDELVTLVREAVPDSVRVLSVSQPNAAEVESAWLPWSFPVLDRVVMERIAVEGEA